MLQHRRGPIQNRGATRSATMRCERSRRRTRDLIVKTERTGQGLLRLDLEDRDGEGLEVDGEIFRVVERAALRGDCVGMVERCDVRQLCGDGVECGSGLLVNAGALESYEQS